MKTYRLNGYWKTLADNETLSKEDLENVELEIEINKTQFQAIKEGLEVDLLLSGEEDPQKYLDKLYEERAEYLRDLEALNTEE